MEARLAFVLAPVAPVHWLYFAPVSTRGPPLARHGRVTSPRLCRPPGTVGVGGRQTFLAGTRGVTWLTSRPVRPRRTGHVILCQGADPAEGIVDASGETSVHLNVHENDLAAPTTVNEAVDDEVRREGTGEGSTDWTASAGPPAPSPEASDVGSPDGPTSPEEVGLMGLVSGPVFRLERALAEIIAEHGRDPSVVARLFFTVCTWYYQVVVSVVEGTAGKFTGASAPNGSGPPPPAEARSPRDRPTGLRDVTSQRAQVIRGLAAENAQMQATLQSVRDAVTSELTMTSSPGDGSAALLGLLERVDRTNQKLARRLQEMEGEATGTAELRSELGARDEQIALLTKSAQMADFALLAARTQAEEIRLQLEAETAKTRVLEDQLDRLQAVVPKLEATTWELDKKARRFEDSNEKLVVANEQLTERLMKAEDEVAVARSALEESEVARLKLQVKYQDAVARVDRAQALEEEVDRGLAKIRTHADNEQRLMRELEAATGRLRFLEEQVEAAEAARELAEREKDGVKKEEEMLRDALESAARQTDVLGRRISELEDEARKLLVNVQTNEDLYFGAEAARAELESVLEGVEDREGRLRELQEREEEGARAMMRLEDRIQILEREIEALERSKEESVSTIEALQGELSGVRVERDRLEDELDALKDEVGKVELYEDRIDLLERGLAQVEQEKEVVSNELREARNQLEAAIGGKEGLEDTIDVLKRGLAQAEEEREVVENELREAKNRLDAAIGEKEGLEDRVDVLGRELAEVEAEKERLEAEVEKLGDEMKNVEVYEDKIDVLERALKTAEEERELVGMELAEAKNRLEALIGEKQGLEDRLAKLPEEVEILRERLGEREGELEEVVGREREMSKKVEGLESGLGKERERCRSLERQLDSSDRLQAGLEEKVEMYEKDVEALRSAMEGLKGTLASAQNELQDAVKEMEGAKGREGEMKSLVDVLEMKVLELEEEMEKKEEESGGLRERAEELQTMLARAEALEKSVQGEVMGLREQVGRLEREREDLEAQVEELKVQMKAQEEAIGEWDRKVLEVREEGRVVVEEMEEEMERLREQVRIEEEELEEARREQERLKAQLESRAKEAEEAERRMKDWEMESNEIFRKLIEEEARNERLVAEQARKLEEDRRVQEEDERELGRARERLEEVMREKQHKELLVAQKDEELTKQDRARGELQRELEEARRRLEDVVQEKERRVEEEGKVRKEMEGELKLAKDTLKEMEERAREAEKRMGEAERKAARTEMHAKRLQDTIAETEDRLFQSEADLERTTTELKLNTEIFHKTIEEQEVLEKELAAARSQAELATQKSKDLEKRMAELVAALGLAQQGSNATLAPDAAPGVVTDPASSASKPRRPSRATNRAPELPEALKPSPSATSKSPSRSRASRSSSSSGENALRECPHCGKEFRNLTLHVTRWCSANPESQLSSRRN